MILAGVPINESPTGLFVEMPAKRGANGRWYPIVRFPTVAEDQAFKAAILAALMREYPEDFVGFEAEKPRNIK